MLRKNVINSINRRIQFKCKLKSPKLANIPSPGLSDVV